MRGKRATITRSTIITSGFDDILLALYESDDKDPCTKIVKKYFDTQNIKNSEVLLVMLICLYRVGAIGVKISTLDTFVWSYVDQSTISKGEVKRSHQIKIHKMLYRALDIAVDQTEVLNSKN